MGSNHSVKFSKTTMRHAKNRERKDPSQGVMQKCVPQERIPWAPKFEERRQEEPFQQERCVRREAWDPAKAAEVGLKQERCARRDAWDLAKEVYKLTKRNQKIFLLSCRGLGSAGTLFDKARTETLRDRLWNFCAHVK